VTAVVVPAVHQHGVQDVVGRVLGVRLLEELIEGQLLHVLKPAEEREDDGEAEMSDQAINIFMREQKAIVQAITGCICIHTHAPWMRVCT